MAAGINISDLAAEKSSNSLRLKKEPRRDCALRLWVGQAVHHARLSLPYKRCFSQRLCGVAQVKRCRTKQRECTPQPSGTGHASQRFFYREVGSQ